MIGIAGGIVIAALLAQAAPGQQPCPVSDDPTYGHSLENPVQIGGGAFYVKAREARYLSALRGPEGQTVRFTRRGTAAAPDDELTLVDVYEVTYDGLETPVTLYLDAYHYWEQRAPKGFTCVQPIQLQPMLDQMRASETMQAVAAKQGQTQSFAPIPLEPGGAMTRGAMWDVFRMLAVAASRAEGGGQRNAGTLIAAYPVTCDDTTVAPTLVEIVSVKNPPLRRSGDLLRGDALNTLLPGVTIPEGSLATLYPLEHPRPGDAVRIVYESAACDAGKSEVILPVVVTPARGVAMPQGTLPHGADPTQGRLLMQAVIDTTGAFVEGRYVGGPKHLRAAAADVLKEWRAEPARVNGAPVLSSTLLEVRFK